MLHTAHCNTRGRKSSWRVVVAGIVVSGALVGSVTSSAQALPPVIATDGAHATGVTSAVVEGNGDPEGQSTTLYADYALASEPWCTSGGVTGSLAQTMPQELGSGHAMLSEIVVKLDGLAPGSEYCAELVAANASGTAHGGQVRFTTPAQALPPVIATQVVEAPAATSFLTPPPPVAGNAPKPLAKAVQLARALRLCYRRPKNQRATCTRRVRRRYGIALKRRIATQTSEGKK
jgi:hypothetical protein